MGIKPTIYFVPSVIWFAGILVLSFIPSQNFNPELNVFTNQDLVIHTIMYGVFAGLCLWGMRKSNVLSKRLIWITVISITVLGGLIEIFQPILSNRTADIFDVLSNALGAIIAGFIGKRGL